MKSSLTLPVLLLIAPFLAACQSTAPTETAQPQAAAGFVQITQRADFVALIEGKKFLRDGNSWSISGDGRMFGNFKKGPLVGTWEWRQGAWCRIYVLGGQTKEENCQLVSVKGNQVKFVKDRGKGEVSVERLSN